MLSIFSFEASIRLFCKIIVLLWLLNADKIEDLLKFIEENLFGKENLLSSENGEKNDVEELNEYIESKDKNFFSEKVLKSVSSL